jgi:hypothetical protein
VTASHQQQQRDDPPGDGRCCRKRGSGPRSMPDCRLLVQSGHAIGVRAHFRFGSPANR